MSNIRPKPTPARPPASYGIQFETTGHAGFIKYLKITIEEDYMELDDTVAINLSEDPNFKQLVNYVKGNS